MTKQWNQGCALWFWRYMNIEYEIFDHEIEAAKFASTMEDNDFGSPVGLQYSDGRTVKVEDWQAFKDAQKTYELARKTMSPIPPRPTRLILNPFDGAPKRIDAEEPKWLGVRPETLVQRQEESGK